MQVSRYILSLLGGIGSCLIFAACAADDTPAGTAKPLPGTTPATSQDSGSQQQQPRTPVVSVNPANRTTPEKTPQVPAPPAQPLARQAKPPGITVSSVPCGRKVVALTFDDGPHPALTPQLLEILKAEQVPATFFVLGKNVQLYPQIVKLAADQGHEIGNHSWNHPVLSKCAAAKVESELQRTHDVVKTVIGKDMVLMRPPYGAFRQDQRAEANRKWGYRVILWDVDPLDWKKPGAATVARRLIDRARPGSILLAHDIHPGTIAAIPQVIRTLKAQGYQFITVSNLIALGEAAGAQPAAAPQTPAQPAPPLAPVLAAPSAISGNP